MEKKNYKFVKIILIFIIFLIIFLMIILSRKFFILEKLDKKISNIENNNIYAKVVTDIATTEIFIKDDIQKTIIDRKDGSTKITEIISQEGKKTFLDTPDTKELHISKKENNNKLDYSLLKSDKLTENFLNSLKVGIKKVDLDGIKCYEITNFDFDDKNDNEKIAYINIETGLPVKVGEKTYEIKFNCVTDEDVKEPDNSSYTIMESEI